MENILELPIEKYSRIQPRILKEFQKLGIKTIRDLLYHFPRRYEDFSTIKQIKDLTVGETATVRGVVKKIEGKHAWRKRMTIIEILIGDSSGQIPALWFNQHYLLKTLRAGDTISLSGPVKLGKRGKYLLQPGYEKINTEDALLRHTGRIIPVYPETRGLTSRWFRFLLNDILAKLPKNTPDIIPSAFLASEHLMAFRSAIAAIHFPRNLREGERAEERFSFEELFLLQLKKLLELRRREKARAIPFSIDRKYLDSLIEALPFPLTKAQEKSLNDILHDIQKPHPMNRLLNGDVGSGKTVIAGIAALIAVQNKFQVAFMAPTEILARQHFETLRKLFPNTAYSIGLCTASEKRIVTPQGEFPKPNIQKLAQNGTIDLLIGTHTLIQDSVHFKNLGLVIIDEQHRFGVLQRAKLSKHIELRRNTLPHLLSMTATPIPRTLALTLYGDLNISVLDELPPGRKKIITKIVRPDRRAAAYAFVKKEVQKGRQAFVICPRIEIPETNGVALSQKSFLAVEVKTVKEEYKKLSETIFPELRIGMLHGKLKAKEKQSVMDSFKSGVLDILVATSVIEVGVDVPNASIMMIEGTERFGLAQLHQFRGRVGRGSEQAYCLLFPSNASSEWNEQLKTVAMSDNGFILAEYDLKLRGPGSLAGYEQSGFDLPLQKALSNIRLVEKTSNAAEKLLQEDPELKKYPLLAKRITEVEYTLHTE